MAVTSTGFACQGSTHPLHLFKDKQLKTRVLWMNSGTGTPTVLNLG